MKSFEIVVKDIQKKYNHPVLKKISLIIKNGDFISIVGESGSGKSTLVNILGLIEEYDSGEIIINNQKLHKGWDYAKIRNQMIGFIYQNYQLLPSLTCYENIELPTIYSKKYNKKDIHEQIMNYASLLGIEKILNQRVSTLSGGEKQRVGIARALINDPSLIIADEPTGNLDQENSEVIMSLLENECARGRAVVLITHDMEAAKRAKKRFVLQDGRLQYCTDV